MSALPASPALAAGPSPLWYTTRATGVVALVLLTFVVVLGVAGAARFASPRWPRLLTSGLHRNISLLLVCFLAVHILTALLDTFAPVGVASVIIPFASAYRPLWLGLGTLAFDLVAALVVTSLLRTRIGRRGWRSVHWAAYAAWPVALWHGLGTGTDARLPLLIGIDIGCVTAVALAAWWRLSQVADPGRRMAGMAAVIVLPLATVLFAAQGPLQPGWALRAGTPASLLLHSGPPATSSAGGAGASVAVRPGALSGTVAQSGSGGQVTVTVTGSVAGTPRERVVVVLHGAAASGGGIALSSGRVRISVGGSAYRGAVTGLNGGIVSASVTSPQGGRSTLQISLNISGGSVSGQVSVSGEGGQ